MNTENTPLYSIIIGPYAAIEYRTLRLISDPYALLGIASCVHTLRLIEYCLCSIKSGSPEGRSFYGPSKITAHGESQTVENYGPSEIGENIEKSMLPLKMLRISC